MNNYDNKLDEILAKARISPMLREAIEEIKEAEQKGDDELVADLSAVKSYIVFGIDPKDKANAFQEDADYNRKVLGSSVYEILDEINFDYAMKTDTMPAGMMVVSNSGIRMREEPKPRTPVLRRMLLEHKRIWKER